jgi:hypothetical protein
MVVGHGYGDAPPPPDLFGDAAPNWGGSNQGGGGGSSLLPTGAGTPSIPGVTSGDFGPRIPGMRRRPMGGGTNPGIMGAMPNAIDPQMVAMIAEAFGRLMQGQAAGGGMQGMGAFQGPPQPGGGIPAFANGGIVTRPTLGLLGEAGPEAVVPLGGRGMQPFGASPGMNPNDPSNWLGGGANGTSGVGQGGIGRMSLAQVFGGANGIQTSLLARHNQGLGLGPWGADPRITEMLRAQAIQDAHAQSRSARLGLMGRSDVDPSTYGFQALMSDLQGQGQVANAVNQSTLQQQMSQQEFIRRLLSQASAQEAAVRAAKAGKSGFDWGGLAKGVGTAVATAV